MAKHIILTDATIDPADVILVRRSGLPQVVGDLAADSYTLRDTSAPVNVTVTGAAIPAPVNTTAPSVTGTPTVGQTLTATEGTWSGSPTITLQWLRGTTAISGATGLTYVLTDADLTATISVRATATNAGGSATATSEAVGPVEVAEPQLPAGAILKLHASDLTGLADGASIETLTDSVGGAIFTKSAGAVAYVGSVAAADGKPGIKLTAATLKAPVAGALNAALQSRNMSVLLLMTDITYTSTAGVLSCALSTSGTRFVLYTSGVPGTNGILGVPGSGVVSSAPPSKPGLNVYGMTSQDVGYGSYAGGLSKQFVDGSQCAGNNTYDLATLAPNLSIGAITDAGANPGSFTLLDLVIWDRTLTPAEMLVAEKWVNHKYNRPNPWEEQGFFYVASGDSITMGTNGGTTEPTGNFSKSSYPWRLAAALNIPLGGWTNVAIGGQTMPNMLANDAAFIADIADVVGVPVIVSAFEYANARTIPNATLLSQNATYVSALRATGAKVIFGTSTSDTGSDQDDTWKAKRQDYNNAVVANAGGIYGDVIVSLHTNEYIGVLGAASAETATTYFYDWAHLKYAGYGELAGMFQPSVAAAIAEI